MHHVWLFVKRVSCRYYVFLIANRKFKFAGQDVGQLFVRMVVHWADRALFKVNFYRHHFAVVRQNTTRHAIAQILKPRLFVENKHRCSVLIVKHCFN
ncbi:hypothetical protein D3C71_902230 [compost metagenome]